MNKAEEQICVVFLEGDSSIAETIFVRLVGWHCSILCCENVAQCLPEDITHASKSEIVLSLHSDHTTAPGQKIFFCRCIR